MDGKTTKTIEKQLLILSECHKQPSYDKNNQSEYAELKNHNSGSKKKKHKDKFELFEAYVAAEMPNVNRKTQNVLAFILSELKTRKEMSTAEAIVYENGYTYTICPNCCITLERDYQKYCDRCGQKLKWISKKKMKFIYKCVYIC